MVKRMSEDEVNNYVHSRMFGDLDKIEADTLFDKGGMDAISGTADNAKPESEMSGGVTITVKPIMAAAQESGKPSDTSIPGEEKEDKLKGISGMSPLMSRIHGDR